MAESKQTVLEHITELRRRLIAVLVVNLGAAVACFHWVEPLMDRLLSLSGGFSLVYIAPSELFGVYVQVALVCGVAVALPFTLFQLWMYVARGLYRHEKVAVACALMLAGGFFAAGVVFAFRLVLPTILDFFLRIAMKGISPMISVAEFLSFVLGMLLCFGVVFEMPVAAGLLSALGLLRPGTPQISAHPDRGHLHCGRGSYAAGCCFPADAGGAYGGAAANFHRYLLACGAAAPKIIKEKLRGAGRPDLPFARAKKFLHQPKNRKF